MCACACVWHTAPHCITVYTHVMRSPSRVTDSGDGNYRTFCF